MEENEQTVGNGLGGSLGSDQVNNTDSGTVNPGENSSDDGVLQTENVSAEEAERVRKLAAQKNKAKSKAKKKAGKKKVTPKKSPPGDPEKDANSASSTGNKFEDIVNQFKGELDKKNNIITDAEDDNDEDEDEDDEENVFKEPGKVNEKSRILGGKTLLAIIDTLGPVVVFLSMKLIELGGKKFGLIEKDLDFDYTIQDLKMDEDNKIMFTEICEEASPEIMVDLSGTQKLIILLSSMYAGMAVTIFSTPIEKEVDVEDQ